MATFAQMPPDRRIATLAWARSHDWGRDAAFAPSSAGAMLTGCACWVQTGPGQDEGHYDRPTFSTLADLMAWAGY